MKRSYRTVAVISRSNPGHALDAVLDSVEHRVVLLGSMAHAYSQIKRSAPDLVVMCVSNDDADACQVLSMLALDAETSRIPVVTHLTSQHDDPTDDDRVTAEDFRPSVRVSLN